MPGDLRIGTAGWTIPGQLAAGFTGGGSHLQRYAGRLRCVEINSSFYRSHRPATYARWTVSVPDDFRFAVKLPREMTHRRKLIGTTEFLERFLSEIGALGGKLGPVLIQLPPSLNFQPEIAGAFFHEFRAQFIGDLVCEPRHPSWFCAAADRMLTEFSIARVAADPAPVPPAGIPGGWPAIAYYRLHGSPEMYWSPYSPERLDRIAAALRGALKHTRETWCIFDNTAAGEAAKDALSLMDRLPTARACPP
jgi:uncharacterized protein YecE (DUF72 family)